jgi:hypothetical protein
MVTSTLYNSPTKLGGTFGFCYAYAPYPPSLGGFTYAPTIGVSTGIAQFTTFVPHSVNSSNSYSPSSIRNSHKRNTILYV